MWTRLTGKNDGSKDPKDPKDSRDDRRSSTSARTKRAESVVSSSSSRRPTRSEPRASTSRNSYPSPAPPASVASSYATARDGASDYTGRDTMPRSRNDDLYDDPREERFSRRRGDSLTSYDTKLSRKERSRSRDREDKKRDKDKLEKRKSRSDRSSGASQAGGYHGEIVESPRPTMRAFGDQIASPGFSQFPGQTGVHMMSGGLPTGSHPPMSSHIPDQFPGQDSSLYGAPSRPVGPTHSDSFGEASDYYGDMGQSVHQQPGVRPNPPSVIMPLDTPHLMSAGAQPNPVEDTGSGAAADFFGSAGTNKPSSSLPQSSMPGAFADDDHPPTKPPRPSSSKPNKPGKVNSAAALAGGAAVGYALGQSSSNAPHSTNYTNGAQSASDSMYYQAANTSMAAAEASHLANYSNAMDGAPPPKPPRPGKNGKQPSSSSNAGLYAAGAAGIAAYGLHEHHSHNHSSSIPGGFPGEHHGGGPGPSPSHFTAGGMAQMHEHKGPVSKFVDWWKDHEDVQKMEEYTEYIGVCRGCFDPRSSAIDAPRKHHYGRKRSSEFRPSGIEKQSRYSLLEKQSRYSLSGDESRRRRKSNDGVGWLAAGLGGIVLAQAGKTLLGQKRHDFDDTYSVKSGRYNHSRVPHRSRSRSQDRKHHSSGRSDVRYRSHSRDRMSRMSVGVAGDRKDYKVVRHRSHSRSRSSSRDRKSGFFGAAVGAGLAASAVGASRKKHRSHSRSRSNSPKGTFVHHRRDSSDHGRRQSKPHRMSHKSSRSSIGTGSLVDISQPHRSQGGFLGGFFTAATPKEKRRKSHSRSKKKKGFFNFGNASSSSDDTTLAFGSAFDRNRRRTTRRTSDERLNATLAGLGATAAAIAATKAGRSKGKNRAEVVAVKEQRHQRTDNDRRRYGASSRHLGEEEDGWESLPEDDTSDSGSASSGLAFGDYDWKKGKSQESLAS
ncbi:hypothetical protein BDV95DRAFT_556674, partial [Massariosphaeria phaeospora]